MATDLSAPRRYARASAIATAAIALTVVLGWITHTPVLGGWVPGAIGMKFNGAIAFCFGAAALWLLTIDSRRSRYTAFACTLLMGAIAFTTFLQHVTSMELGIDELLVKDTVADPVYVAPGRMALNSTICFIGLSVAGLLLSRRRGAGARLRTTIFSLILCTSFFVAVGYLYGVQAYYSPGTIAAMALPTALCFFLMAGGMLLVDPAQSWLRELLFCDLTGGSFFRFSIPVLLAGTTVVGLLRIAAEQSGLVDTRTGVAAFVTVSSVMMAVVTIGVALRLNTNDVIRRRSEAALREAHDELERRVDERTRQLQAERDFSSAIVDTAGALIVVLDADMRILRFNHTCEKVTGYREAEVAGKSVLDVLVPGEEIEGVTRVAGELVTHLLRNSHENYWRTRDGSLRRIAWSNAPISRGPGSPTYVVSCGIDVTEERHAQDEARSQREELEAFAYSVSHDLRAPLRAIEGFSAALLEDCSERLTADGLDHLARIRGATTRMSELIESLLSLSRVTRAPLEMQRVDLAAMASEIAATLARGGREVDLTIDEPLTARGDSRLIRAMLQNLLDNAWKFTSKTAVPRVYVGALPNGTFFVADNGAGFDMSYANDLFKPFHRLHSGYDFPGTGIGLATVHRIVSKHGGAIQAVGAPGHGATFYFTLSRATAIPADLPLRVPEASRVAC